MAAGDFLIDDDGKISLLSDGKAAVKDASDECSDCCGRCEEKSNCSFCSSVGLGFAPSRFFLFLPFFNGGGFSPDVYFADLIQDSPCTWAGNNVDYTNPTVLIYRHELSIEQSVEFGFGLTTRYVLRIYREWREFPLWLTITMNPPISYDGPPSGGWGCSLPNPSVGPESYYQGGAGSSTARIYPCTSWELCDVNAGNILDINTGLNPCV